MLGEPPKMIPITFEKTKYSSIKQWMKNLIWDREEALAAHELAMRMIADRWKNTFTPFKKGDMVWLNIRNFKTTNNPKIRLWQEGLFKISGLLGPLTYQSNHSALWRIHNVFHAILLWLDCPWAGLAAPGPRAGQRWTGPQNPGLRASLSSWGWPLEPEIWGEGGVKLLE